MDSQIKELAKKLDITYEEARELYEEDKKVDRMDMKYVNDDINTDQQKAIKKYSNVARGRETTKVDAYGKKTKRVVKDDEVKQMIINHIAESLKCEKSFDNISIPNKQKIITFTIGADTFEIDLKRKRKEKK